MQIDQIRVDTIKDIVTNVYIVTSKDEVMVIDPGGESEKIIAKLDEIDLPVKYILLTHCHSDHIGALTSVQEAKGGKVLVSKGDEDGVNNPIKNLGPFVGNKVKKIEVNMVLKEGDIIYLGENEFKVIETPGHTKGGISIYCEKEKALFSGDTLFKGTYGRTDLPTGNYLQMKKSIKKLLELPDDVLVYPGHGAPTTIGEERDLYKDL